MDASNVVVIEKAISSISHDNSTTIIMATHNIYQAERLEKKIDFLLEGELVEVGNTEEVLTAPRNDRPLAFVKGEMIY